MGFLSQFLKKSWDCHLGGSFCPILKEAEAISPRTKLFIVLIRSTPLFPSSRIPQTRHISWLKLSSFQLLGFSCALKNIYIYILSSGYAHHIFYSGIIYIIWETSYCFFFFFFFLPQARQDFPKFQAFNLSLTLQRFSNSCSWKTEGPHLYHSYEKKHPIISDWVRILASSLTSCLTGASYIIISNFNFLFCKWR